jgi:hypothetical protein
MRTSVAFLCVENYKLAQAPEEKDALSRASLSTSETQSTAEELEMRTRADWLETKG